MTQISFATVFMFMIELWILNDCSHILYNSFYPFFIQSITIDCIVLAIR